MRGNSGSEEWLRSSPGKGDRTVSSALAAPLHLSCDCSGLHTRRHPLLTEDRSLGLGEDSRASLPSCIPAQC